MLHIFGKNIPTKKNLIYALNKLFGINISNSKIICKNIGLNPLTRIEFLNENQIKKLVKYIDLHFIIEQDLKKQKSNEKKKLLNIKSYKGLRNFFGLPSNGQRTHTNAKTKKK